MDVLAFRLHYKLFQSAADRAWREKRLAELCQRFPEVPRDTPVLISASANSAQARDFIRSAAPDLMIARCKVILKEEIFTIPRIGEPSLCIREFVRSIGIRMVVSGRLPTVTWSGWA